jgi:hypothetical protein
MFENAIEIRLASSKTLFFHILRQLYMYYNFLNGTRIHDISNTYVPFPQLFAKGKSLKSEGIGMPLDKNKGLHGDLGNVEPIAMLIPRRYYICTSHAHFAPTTDGTIGSISRLCPRV